MSYIRAFISLLTLFVLLDYSTLNAQKFGVTLDGGRFMWQVEPRNQSKRWELHHMNSIYPGDFRTDPGYTNLLHGGMQHMTIDKSHPWAEPNALGVLENGPSGGTTLGDQKKFMRYAYPIITVNGEDAGRFQDPEFIIDPNLDCEMKGFNRARSLFGITYYTTTYSWSHPDYQEIIIQHDEIINDGNWFKHWDPPNEDTVDVNDYNQFFMQYYRWYMGGFKSKTFSVYETNWNFWGFGVQDDITDSNQVMMYQWNPDLKETSPLEDEGEWNIEDSRFWYPYYFGFGYLDANGPLYTGGKHQITRPLHWWGAEGYPHNLKNKSQSKFRFFLEARTKYGVDPGLIQIQPDPKSYANPHDRDPDDDVAWSKFLRYGGEDNKMLMYFGPFDISIGDTINVWTTHLAGGINPHKANELGNIWGEKRDVDAYPRGWSEEDIKWKNNILRTEGRSDMISGYAKAREIYANGMQIPKMNLVPPARININPGGGQVDIDWSSVAGAVTYNIYRGEGELDKLLYNKLDSVNSSTTVYADSTARRNFSYYYYITAVDVDGIESSHYTVRPLVSVTPFSEQGKSLEDVRVVPNPFVLGKGGFGEGAEDRIIFAGLPGPCKITIFTVTGDILEEINHTVQDGSHQWNSRTKFNQIITSGVYVYHVESTEGKGSKIGKFIVVR